MKVDYTEAGKASCRLALETYGKALERHREEAEQKLNIGTVPQQMALGNVEQLRRHFSTESKATTIEFSNPLRVAMVDALNFEIREVQKLEGKIETHLIDRNDLERQVTRLRKLAMQLQDQTAIEFTGVAADIDAGAIRRSIDQEVHTRPAQEPAPAKSRRKRSSPPPPEARP